MNLFNLVVYAVVALVMVAFVIVLMPQFFPQENIYLKIENGLELAKAPSQYGQLVEIGKTDFKKGFILNRDNINIDNISLALECTDPNNCCTSGEKCAKAIEWDNKAIKFKKNRSMNVYARCYAYFSETVCRIYFGLKPAQAKIGNIEYTQNNGQIIAIVTLTNTGNAILGKGKNSVRLMKKVENEWRDTETIFPEKEIDLIPPKQTIQTPWEINLTTSGEYNLLFRFEGENAGYDENGIIIRIGENTNCEIIEAEPEIQDLNQTHVREVYHCVGCNFSYECLTQWKKKNPTINYEDYQKNAVYFVRKMFDKELCDRSLGIKTGYYTSIGTECKPGFTKMTSVVNYGICCEKLDPLPQNPCEENPTSTECIVNWLPQNPTYSCPTTPELPIYNNNCNANEWFNVSWEQ